MSEERRYSSQEVTHRPLVSGRLKCVQGQGQRLLLRSLKVGSKVGHDRVGLADVRRGIGERKADEDQVFSPALARKTRRESHNVWDRRVGSGIGRSLRAQIGPQV